MKTPARYLSLLSIVMLMLAICVPAQAQERGGDRGERGGERDDRNDWRERWENATDEEREEMRQEMRKRMEERRAEYEERQAEDMRERLDMSVEDYEVIGPMIAKVRAAMRERDSALRGAGRGDRGNRGNRGGGEDDDRSDGVKSATEAMAELRQAIEDDNSGDIKSALAKLRKARTELNKAVDDAQEELRSVCSAKWEAEFVVMGVLD